MQRDTPPPGAFAELLAEWGRYLYDVLRPPQLKPKDEKKPDYKRANNLPRKQ